MATINAVNTTLSGQSGSGSFVGTIAPTLTQITFSTTSGIIGTTTNDNAAAGSVGESKEAALSGAVNYGGSNVATNIQTLSLTTGDWDVYGYLLFSHNGSTTSLVTCAISLTSAVETPVSPTAGCNFTNLAGNISAYPTGRVSISGTQTVYLVSTANYTVGLPQAYAAIIARRRR